MTVAAYGPTIEEALEDAYENVDIIDFNGKYYRKDLGFDQK